MSNINCTSQVLFVKENIQSSSILTDKLTTSTSNIKFTSYRTCISDLLNLRNDMLLRHL